MLSTISLQELIFTTYAKVKPYHIHPWGIQHPVIDFQASGNVLSKMLLSTAFHDVAETSNTAHMKNGFAMSDLLRVWWNLSFYQNCLYQNSFHQNSTLPQLKSLYKIQTTKSNSGTSALLLRKICSMTPYHKPVDIPTNCLSMTFVSSAGKFTWRLYGGEYPSQKLLKQVSKVFLSSLGEYIYHHTHTQPLGERSNFFLSSLGE